LFVAWVIFHVLVCLALILVVLMQSSKGEGLAGSAFGGGLSSAVFGGRGAATFLSKATTILAILFMVNCGALAFMSAQTRVTATGAPVSGSAESAVTRQAQEEMQRQAQQQQQQSTASGSQQVTPGEAAPFTPGDTGGK